VVVYTSQDRVYAEPIFQEFTRQTGIKVSVLYDSEAAKTVGLANRLQAESSHPQCDLFWNNEELRTWQLASRGVLLTNWASLGYRTRRIVVNTNKLSLLAAPGNMSQLTNRAWYGKIALAYPLFGTTATHFLALRQSWGHEPWLAWCQALQANKPFLVDGNSVVVNLVGRGEAWVGITDSDDVAAGQSEGLPVASITRNSSQMLIPNTIAFVAGQRHPREARELFAYLQRPAIAQRLVEVHALDSGSPVNSVPERLQINYRDLLNDLEAATRALEKTFLR
jgi:iron(III) transport system substrate-binding protein